MPTVILVRHGDNEYVRQGRLAGRLPGVHLNHGGQQQAQRLVKYLEMCKLAGVYSSPLERAMETAMPIAIAHSLQVVPNPGLIEMDYGDWQGKPLKQLQRRKLWHTIQNTPSLAVFPKGESFYQAQSRIANEIENLCSTHKARDCIVCVGHCDMIKLAVAYYIGLPLDQFQCLVVQPGSLTTLRIHQRNTQLLNMNILPLDQS